MAPPLRCLCLVVLAVGVNVVLYSLAAPVDASLPVVSRYLPAAQAVHWEEPVLSEYWPTTQSMQSVPKAQSEYDESTPPSSQVPSESKWSG